jgi:arylsulfatase
VILVDDMGFSDLGCHGGEIPTPHLDALAANGLRFSQCYNTARCCPTRASLLTGLSSHQAGVGHMTDDEHLPGYRGRLNDECVTIAEVLGDAGYFTCMAGKWHVGQNNGVAPWNRGFQRSVNPASGGFYYAGSPRYDLSLDGEQLAADDPRLPTDWYTTDLWTTFGLRFIDEAREAGKPFFLYLAHNAPHFPLQAPAAEIETFRGRYRDGWELLARRRFERQQALGLVDPRWTPASRPDAVAAWESLSPAEKERFDHLMAAYATTVHLMDRAVGSLVQGLRDRGVLDDTLILFLSDNGGTHTDTYSGGYRAGKGTPYQGGTHAPSFWRWPRVIHAAVDCPALSAHIDILPTLAEIADVKLDESTAAQVEGKSLLPLLKDPQSAWPERTLVTHLGRWPKGQYEAWKYKNCAIRSGNYRLVNNTALYDVATDRSESKDIATEHPEIVARLRESYDKWWQETVPLLVNEDVIAPMENPFKVMYRKQFGPQEK